MRAIASAFELEVEDREVLGHARRRHGLREDDVGVLDVPAQDDLRRRAADRLGDRADNRIAQHLALRDRRPGLRRDAVRPAVGIHVGVGEVGVQLDLVDGRHNVAFGREPLQVRHLEVRHADRARAAVRPQLLEHPPRRDEVAVVERGQRPVDEKQVDAVEAELLQRPVERATRVVRPVKGVAELARHEDLVARQPGGPDRVADAALVAVHLGRVDVPVADLEGRRDGLRGLRGIDLKDPEAELRDRGAVVELDLRDGADGAHAHAPRVAFGGGAPAYPQRRDPARQRSSIRASSSRAPAFASGSLRFPHFGDCTHDGQPSWHGHSKISRCASPTSVSKRR
jgi:hypothetical protein